MTLAQAVEGIAGEDLIAQSPASSTPTAEPGIACSAGLSKSPAGRTSKRYYSSASRGPSAGAEPPTFPSPEDPNVAAGADTEGRPHPGIASPPGPRSCRLPLVGGSVYSTARELARFARSDDRKTARACFPRKGLSGRSSTARSRANPTATVGACGLPDGSNRATGLRHNGALAASRASLVIDLESGELRGGALLHSGAPRAEAEKRVRAALAPYL